MRGVAPTCSGYSLGSHSHACLAAHIDDVLQQDVRAQKLQLPLVVSSELWQRSGRLDTAGEELFSLRDRHQHPLHLGAFGSAVVCQAL